MNDSHEKVASTQELAKQIDKWMVKGENQLETKIPGLKLTRWPHVTSPTSYIHQPSICLIAQGKKRVLLGDESYVYDDHQFLVSSVGLPVIANIIEASDERPYLGLVLELDLQVISELIAENQHLISHAKKPQKGIAVGLLSDPLLNAFIRLIKLLDEGDNIKVLAPIIQREIFFRILTTAQGILFNQIVTVQSHSYQISKAVDWLRQNFCKPINISKLADFSGMSLSAFYTHFRSVTAMTPLQFQKSLRLNEARRLMLTENLDAMTTTFKVGYESPSQFSREYSRMFGVSPKRDVELLRAQLSD